MKAAKQLARPPRADAPVDVAAIASRLTDPARNYRSWRSDMRALLDEIERITTVAEDGGVTEDGSDIHDERVLSKLEKDFAFARADRPFPAWLRRRVVAYYPKLIAEIRWLRAALDDLQGR